MKRREVLNKAIDTYGPNAQKLKAIEELGELIQAIAKYENGIGYRASVIEEIADVEIMLEQLKLIYFITENEVETVKEYKVERLNQRLTQTKVG